jgi:hypothetical protein
MSSVAPLQDKTMKLKVIVHEAVEGGIPGGSSRDSRLSALRHWSEENCRDLGD